eukprot:gene2903-3614_t
MVGGGESYLMAFCSVEENCMKYFNWTEYVAEDADVHFKYYSQQLVTKNFLGDNIKNFNFDTQIMEPKRSYRKSLMETKDVIKTNYTEADPAKRHDGYPVVSWLASQCNQERRTSNRMEYISELMKYVPVHSLGLCLNNYQVKENEGGRHGEGFYSHKKNIIANYKFYFSFENSMCRGYFTEKPVQCYESGTVPIVMMHPDTLKYLPRGSYIYVGDFNSAKELADYLIYLDKNDEEYKRYFKWRTNEQLIKEWQQQLVDLDEEECEIARLYNRWRKGEIPRSKQSHRYADSQYVNFFNSNYKPKPILYIKAGNTEWGEKTERVFKNLTCDNGQTIKFSYSNDIDYDMEWYFDADLSKPELWPSKMPKERVPRVLFSGESFLLSNCMVEEQCAKYFNWSYLAASDTDIHYMYYTKHKVIDRFLNHVDTFDFEKDVMAPKLAYREELAKKNEKMITEYNEDNPAKRHNGYPLVSWMTRNCGSERRTSNRVEYVQEMIKHIPVHSMGSCLNNYKIEGNERSHYAHILYTQKKNIISKYKFYFAFENSMCRGYFTEKPIHCYEAGTVPIVMMHPDTLQFLPRGSYIYVGDFKSAKELADYLVYLDQNDDEYKKYFKWRTNEKLVREWMERIKDVHFDREECEVARIYNQWRSGNYFMSKQLHKYKESECKSPEYFQIK